MLSEEDFKELSKDSFIPYFEQIDDSRDPLRIFFSMREVLFLVVCSVLSGYESNRGIEDFGLLKLEWLRNFFPYEKGIPSHYTIGNVIGLIDKKAFETCFLQWAESQFGIKDWQVHIDGKRISSSVDKRLQGKKKKEGGRRANLIVNAYVSASRAVIAQVDVSTSEDEKEGARELIEQLDLKGKTITGDGNFCTKDLLKRIKKEKGEYLMTLKKNQPTLFSICESCFADIPQNHPIYQTKENAHGRYEHRIYQALSTDLLDYPKFKEYSGLKYFIKVVRKRTEKRKKKTTEDTHYYMTSSTRPLESLASLIRNHWSVENSLHWVLDVEFKEDDCRKRTGNQASNFSVIRKIALNLINKHRGKKAIMAMRMACAVSDEIRKNVLGFL